MTASRRAWIRAASGAACSALAAAAAVPLARRLGAQERPAGLPDTSNLFPMDQSAARSVRLPPKPGARASMTPLERDALQRQIRCQCGCTLDVYTCRTTDFSCQVSPAMHRDVMALVEGGYTAREILDSFVNVYGERVLMAPTKEGFNLLAWTLPGAAIAAGAVVLALTIRRWHRERLVAAAGRGGEPSPPDATPEELSRLEDAIRRDE